MATRIRSLPVSSALGGGLVLVSHFWLHRIAARCGVESVFLTHKFPTRATSAASLRFFGSRNFRSLALLRKEPVMVKIRIIGEGPKDLTRCAKPCIGGPVSRAFAPLKNSFSIDSSISSAKSTFPFASAAFTKTGGWPARKTWKKSPGSSTRSSRLPAPNSNKTPLTFRLLFAYPSRGRGNGKNGWLGSHCRTGSHGPSPPVPNSPNQGERVRVTLVYQKRARRWQIIAAQLGHP